MEISRTNPEDIIQCFTRMQIILDQGLTENLTG